MARSGLKKWPAVVAPRFQCHPARPTMSGRSRQCRMIGADASPESRGRLCQTARATAWTDALRTHNPARGWVDLFGLIRLGRGSRRPRIPHRSHPLSPEMRRPVWTAVGRSDKAHPRNARRPADHLLLVWVTPEGHDPPRRRFPRPNCPRAGCRGRGRVACRPWRADGKLAFTGPSKSFQLIENMRVDSVPAFGSLALGLHRGRT